MALRCNCGSSVRLTDDNGTPYPGTRVEHYECVDCDATGTLILSEDGVEITGCLTDSTE